MNGKNFLAVFLLSAMCVVGTSAAQDTAPASANNAAVSQARTLLQAGRKEILQQEIRFTDDEAAKFWPLYEQYQATLQVVRDRYAEMLVDYINSYRAGTVTEDRATRLVDDYLGIEAEILDIKKSFIGDFREILPARKAARFYQLENKMEVELQHQLSMIVPLIDPV